MANLRAAPARPRPARVSPSYPRAAATLAAAALLLAGCGGIVENGGRATDDQTQTHAKSDAGDTGPTSEPDFPGPAGAAPYPYRDSGPDAGDQPTPAPSDPAPVDAGPAPDPAPDPAPVDAGPAPDDAPWAADAAAKGAK